ncbi:fimbrial protein [Pantoea agglomerans]|uniref:Fimbrial protein n=1 Tax=Enterobacter agglomerans TaxID=549 RepID=A0AAN2FFB1_ENTAG|nr:fimbrial protein [Pantoea agglomerans]MBN9930589.1 fimbrial protein [Pantoea agglomerans]WVL89129.1 fimbrial protein [Pantoea agglomerans]CAH6321183.1 fimbrial protein [Pantoea agglomerans]
MLRIYVFLFCAIVMSPGAWAACTIARGQPTQLAINAQTITITADAAIDTTTPIAQFDTPATGSAIGYDACLAGTEYGKRVVNLTGQDSSTRIYPTNISGIGIKILFSNGRAFGNFPSTSTLTFPNGETEGTLDLPAGSFFRVQLFKTGNIKLSDPTGNTIIPAGLLAYYYIVSDNPASYIINLTVGEMKLISTPTCATDGTKTVDFNTVTPSLLKAGVTRDLGFSITCKSDYGSYAAKASMITNSPSSDGTYIRVLDATGNSDSLGIRITDGLNQLMNVNGTTTEDKNSTSQGPTEFTWKATLIPGKSATPAGGTFTAAAEILFDIQ